MRKYRIPALLTVLPLLLSLLVLPAGALEEPELYCRNAVLLDANFNEVLYDKGAHEKAWPASTTKVMTALLTIEAIDQGRISLTDKIAAGPTRMQDIPAGKGYATVGLKEGEVLTVEDLLYCLMLPSAADAANVLAVAVDGSIEAFVEHMNRKAGELGCRNTHFTNTAGMHNEEHYSTAYDLALIFQAGLEHELFRTVIGTVVYTVPATDLSPERKFYNSCGLISNWNYSGYTYDKCIGGKTGNTEEAGRCMVSAAQDGDTLLVAAILGSGPVDIPGYAEKRQGQLLSSSNLLKWGFKNFHRVTITEDSKPVAKVAVTLSRQADEVNVKPQGSITRTLPRDLDLEMMEREISLISDTVEAPVKEGQVLGVMKLYYQGEFYGMLDLVAVNSVERSELLYKKAQFLAFFRHTGVQLLLGAVLLIATAILLRVLVFRKRRRYRSSSARSRGNYRGIRR